MIGTATCGLTFVGVGVASIAVRNALFSWGVGAMLMGYGALVLAIAWAGWRGFAFATGAMIAAALLHIVTVASYLSGPGWYWAALVLAVPLSTFIAALWQRVIAMRG